MIQSHHAGFLHSACRYRSILQARLLETRPHRRADRRRDHPAAGRGLCTHRRAAPPVWPLRRHCGFHHRLPMGLLQPTADRTQQCRLVAGIVGSAGCSHARHARVSDRCGTDGGHRRPDRPADGVGSTGYVGQLCIRLCDRRLHGRSWNADLCQPGASPAAVEYTLLARSVGNGAWHCHPSSRDTLAQPAHRGGCDRADRPTAQGQPQAAGSPHRYGGSVWGSGHTAAGCTGCPRHRRTAEGFSSAGQALPF